MINKSRYGLDFGGGSIFKSVLSEVWIWQINKIPRIIRTSAFCIQKCLQFSGI